jgi:hypothetical protein
MLAWMVLHVPLALFPFATASPPKCQLEVLPPVVIEQLVLQDFNHRVDQYVRLHRRLERALPPEQLFDDLEDMSGAVDALHEAIADTRPNARAGNMFTAAVATTLSRALERSIADNGYTAAEVLAAMNVGYLPGMPEPEINGRFPVQRDIQVWPALLAVLPVLPRELHYRFVNRDLVLVDSHADLVVDILKDALPAR